MSLRTYRHSVCTNLVCVASRHFHANQRQPVKFSFPARPTSGRNHGQGLRLLELDIADVKTQKYRRDQMTTCTSTVPEGRDGSMRCTHTENVGRRRQAVGTRQARCLITGFENSIAQTPVIRPRCSTPPRLLISILLFIIPTSHCWLSKEHPRRHTGELYSRAQKIQQAATIPSFFTSQSRAPRLIATLLSELLEHSATPLCQQRRQTLNEGARMAFFDAKLDQVRLSHHAHARQRVPSAAHQRFFVT